MLVLLFLVFSWIPSHSYLHDMPIALFDLKASKNAIELEMKFIKEDMEASLKANYPNTNISNEADKIKVIENYLSTHLRWTINNSPKKYIINQISEDEHHIFINAIFSKPQDTIQRIEIYNTCLLEQIYNHSNIMSFHFHGKERMFRLHRKRTSTAIEY